MPRSVPPRLLGLLSAVLVSATVATVAVLPNGTAPDDVHPSVATAKRYLGPRMTVAITQAVVGVEP
ncbi:hypothetical protein DEI95_14525 [Curtobacterium sp. MCBD17_008]|nr:hypothetical protein DEI95_14525 [Curtobacterium sp. MCBD17_008]